MTVLDCKPVKCEESHLSVYLLICLCLGTSCVCVSVCSCARVRVCRVEWMLWASLHEGGVCWNVEFGHAADALPLKTLQTEWTDGRPSGRAWGVGFALRPWESLWLTSPAQGADVTGLNGSERSEKLKLTQSTVHGALYECKHLPHILFRSGKKGQTETRRNWFSVEI